MLRQPQPSPRSHGRDARRQAGLALSPVAAALLLVSFSAQAQVTFAPLVLKPSRMLQEQIPGDTRNQLATFVDGDRVTGQTSLDTVAEGNAQLRRGDTVIKANRLEYYQPDDLAKARGDVHINQAGNVYEGPELQLKVDVFEGFFLQPTYRFLRNDAYGKGSRIDFIDDKRAVIYDADYTTCQREPGPSWMPSWILRADRLSLDSEEEVGQADGAVIEFKGVPILPIPSFSFPLSDKRKSGVLPPTIGLDNVNGLDVTLPYYWNIAPNRDATFYPTLMSRRGVNVGGQFRYMESNYNGQLRLDYMPDDRLREANRWGLAGTHVGTYAVGFGSLTTNINLNRVSDDNYWRDFNRNSASLTQRILPNDVQVGWSDTEWSISARALKWQTLQDPLSPIVPPYDKLPQLTATYARTNVKGFDFSITADATRFEADRTLLGQPSATRSYMLAQLSRPWIFPSGFITPKVQLHSTTYDFDAPIANGAMTANRTVPTFSLDSGLVFERDWSLFGRSFRQTLEPRAFYVYTPYRDQSMLPVYDTALNDFNFATVYTENAFGGNDRISDNNLLTLGVSTRLLDPDTGAEAARFGVAQRIRFKDQNVTLPGVAPVTDRLSDVLVGATVNWTPKWSVDSTVQFNPDTERSIRSVIGARYSPSNYRVISAAYRLQRGVSEQIDIGWQWPLNDLWGDKGQDLGAGRGQGGGRWYTVGRINYSMFDKKLVDGIFGLEYDGCCWIGRVVLERLQSSDTTASKRIMFQLEFVGLTRVGSNPLRTLKENIPRYEYLREQVTSPSRFGNYD